MRYWIISEVFYPEEVSTGYVMTKIAEKLNESVDVGVICGPAKYQSDVFKAKYSLSEKILIKRVNSPRFDKNSLVLRFLGYILLTFGVAYRILINIKSSDKVILVTNPPTFLPIVSFLKKILKFNLIIIVHDVFPENAISGGILTRDSLFYKILLALFNRSYQSANKIITVGHDMLELFRKKIGHKIPITVITNWADHSDIFPKRKTSFDERYSFNSKDKIVVQFAGNIGRVQGLDLLFECLADIKNPNYQLVIIGDGAQKKKIVEFATRANLDQVYFIPSRPREEQNDFLNSCDIGLVTLTPGMFGLGVPSKIYNVFSAGKPVIFIGDPNAEISRYIAENDVGWFLPWNDIQAIKDFFDSIGSHLKDEISKKGEKARLLVESKFTKDIILERYREEIIRT